MTMRDLHNNIAAAVAVNPRTISGSNIVSGDIDLAGFNAAEVIAHLGDIDELGGSPVGAAKLEVRHLKADGSLDPGLPPWWALLVPFTRKGLTKGILDHRVGEYAGKLSRLAV